MPIMMIHTPWKLPSVTVFTFRRSYHQLTRGSDLIRDSWRMGNMKWPIQRSYDLSSVSVRCFNSYLLLSVHLDPSAIDIFCRQIDIQIEFELGFYLVARDARLISMNQCIQLWKTTRTPRTCFLTFRFFLLNIGSEDAGEGLEASLVRQG